MSCGDCKQVLCLESNQRGSTKRQVYARARTINAKLNRTWLEVFSDELGPSTVLAPTAYAESMMETHEEERKREMMNSSDDGQINFLRECESENECELSSSNSEGNFDADDAQHYFDDLMVSSLSLSQKKPLRFTHPFLSAMPWEECKTKCAKGDLHYCP